MFSLTNVFKAPFHELRCVVDEVWTLCCENVFAPSRKMKRWNTKTFIISFSDTTPSDT